MRVITCQQDRRTAGRPGFGAEGQQLVLDKSGVTAQCLHRGLRVAVVWASVSEVSPRDLGMLRIHTISKILRLDDIIKGMSVDNTAPGLSLVS